ncbi:hypothetical protein ACSMXM_08820 [Pacificimonas sp. ICDLI1SI03]
MRFAAALSLAALALTSACRPHPADIELLLGARGLNQEQASCVGSGLAQLTDDDWAVLSEMAKETAMTRNDLETMTLADVQDKLAMLGDGQLVTTLARTGLGCMLMHGGEEWAGVIAPRSQAPTEDYPEDEFPEDEPFDLPPETFEM